MIDSSLAAWLDSHINMETAGDAMRLLKPTIERTRTLAKYMGDPQDHVKAIHITGTNGKTSTTRITESLMRAKGLYTGMTVSPHLSHMNERICLDGQPVDDFQLETVLESIRELEAHIPAIQEDPPSWFEIMVTSGFSIMSEEAVDVGIIEVGMGGTFDATNICASEVSVITNVDLDHVRVLGDTREKIASEKSGIIKIGNKVVIGEPDEDIAKIFVDTARDMEAQPLVIGEDFMMLSNEQAVGGRLLSFRTPYAQYNDIFLPMFGAHQGVNTLLSVVAAEAFIDAPLGEDVVMEGCAEARSPGRMEIIHRDPLVMVDGAHNVSGAQALAVALEEEFARSRRIYIVGFTSDKDPVAMLNSLGIEDDDVVIATAANSHRSLDVEVIMEALRNGGFGTIIDAPTVGDALENAMALALDDDHIIVTGSLYLVGEAREIVARRS